jgi:hypothetical protein
MGIYTDEAKVESMLQLTITSSSIPTTSEVAKWISQSESSIADRSLGIHESGDVYIDVPGVDVGHRNDWVYSARTGVLRFDMGKGMVVPLVDMKTPIVSITSLAKNDSSPEAAPSWDALTGWDGSSSGTNYMLMKAGDRQLGYAIWFYDDYPMQGLNRVKLNYTFGHNVDSEIIGQYCTYDVAIKVLMARMGTNEPDGLSMLEGGALGSFVPRQYQERIAEFRYEMLKIEVNHFPSDKEIAIDVI